MAILVHLDDYQINGNEIMFPKCKHLIILLVYKIK